MTLSIFKNLMESRFCRFAEEVVLHKKFVIFWVGLAAIMRLFWIFAVDTQPVSDFNWYFERAIEISRGNGYSIDGKPTAFWPVGYPAFVGIVLFVFRT